MKGGKIVAVRNDATRLNIDPNKLKVKRQWKTLWGNSSRRNQVRHELTTRLTNPLCPFSIPYLLLAKPQCVRTSRPLHGFCE